MGKISEKLVFGITVIRYSNQITIRLININKQDPGLSVNLKQFNQATKSTSYGFFTKKPIFALLIATFIFTPFAFAHAGFFTFLGGLFERTTIVFQKEEYNSQNMALLQAAMNPDPNPSKGGGGITIVESNALLPDNGPRGASSGGIEIVGPKSDRISIYVVREGDSLSQIANMFGVSVKTIMWANDISGKGVIQPGQTLVILPVSGVRHSVEKGDTLMSIAKEYEVNLTDILDFNGFDKKHILAVGDTLIVPGGEMQIEAPAAVTRSYTNAQKATADQIGYYMRPLKGGVRSQGIHGYNAVDIAAPYGTAILASAAGEVILSKYAAGNPWFGGYGNYIVVQHPNGAQTVYAHLSDNLVKRGWKVQQGQVIGYMGSTGRSTGSHLHFEIRNDIRNPF